MNILQYRVVQGVARRKALAYTNAGTYVTLKYPNLFNVSRGYPTSGPEINAKVQMRQNEIEQTICRARHDNTLLFYVNPDCEFCERQTLILAYFVEKYRGKIKIDIGTNVDTDTRFILSIRPTILLTKRGLEKYRL